MADASRPSGEPTSPPPVIDLAAAFSSIDATWTPHLAAEVSGHHVRLARLDGAFTWHAHEHEDELFLVIAGTLRIEFRGGDRILGPGQLLCIPAGVEHRPVADQGEVHVLLFEPGTTVSTGATDDPRRVDDPALIHPTSATPPSTPPPARAPARPPAPTPAPAPVPAPAPADSTSASAGGRMSERPSAEARDVPH